MRKNILKYFLGQNIKLELNICYLLHFSTLYRWKNKHTFPIGKATDMDLLIGRYRQPIPISICCIGKTDISADNRYIGRYRYISVYRSTAANQSPENGLDTTALVVESSRKKSRLTSSKKAGPKYHNFLLEQNRLSGLWDPCLGSRIVRTF